MRLPRTGLWTSGFDMLDLPAAAEQLAELEALGYGAVWIPETMGRDGITHSSLLLAHSTSMIVATGIVSIWGRDAMSMRAGQLALAEAFPDRFLLGLGVSHAPMVDAVRGHHYDRPLAAMRAYLDAMDAAPYLAPRPTAEPERVLAALGPKMLELSATKANGAHTYLAPVEHTAFARTQLGPDPMLAVEVTAVLSTDAAAARERARTKLSMYLTLPNYTNNLLRSGWSDADLANGGSDSLVDALVVWGDDAAIAARVREHLDAGASHVCVQTLGDAIFNPTPDDWRALAPALHDLEDV